jgi:hypothetical protein
MFVLLGALLIFLSMYLLYMAIQFIKISEDDYNSYKKGFQGLKSAFTGEITTEREGMVRGDGLNLKTKKLNKKASYSPEHTKRLFSSK